jgi:hypothetical protein
MLILISLLAVGALAGAPASLAAERVYFPSRCTDFAYKPRHVIVACGDGNFQLKQMHWTHWNRYIATGSGVGWVNDCIPYCYNGQFHSYPVTVRLYEPHRCTNGDLQFRKMLYRFTSSHPFARSGKQPFPCADTAY